MEKMHLFWLALSAALLVSACRGNSSGENQQQAGYHPLDTTLCYLRVQGTEAEDSTYLHLDIHQDTVSGLMNWIPAEKDARKGFLYGMHRQDTLELFWVFLQEGREDTLRTRFLLKNKRLYQQAYAVDPATGAQYTPDSGSFTLEFLPVDCPVASVN